MRKLENTCANGANYEPLQEEKIKIEKVFVLARMQAYMGYSELCEPQVFASRRAAIVALEKAYNEAMDCNDIFNSDIDIENLTAFVITNDDEATFFQIYEEEII